jgi:ABC-type glutathione transport system ATPase component
VSGTAPARGETLLEVRDLKVHFPTVDGLVKAVDGISFEIRRGEVLGIVGESGSGKSVSFLTIMGLITARQAQITGEVIFKGRDLLQLPVEEMRHIRGKEMGMVFQDPMTSLHPMYRVGDQIAEAVRAHEKVTKKAAAARAVEMLRKVGIAKPEEGARRYPHQFSGGMRQRAMIAMALVLDPDLLIADEPTTALDVTVQAQILDLIDRTGARPVLQQPPPLHLGLAAIDPAPRRRGESTPQPDQGPAPVPDLRSTRMRVPSPLPLCHGRVPHRRPDAADRTRCPPVGLPSV